MAAKPVRPAATVRPAGWGNKGQGGRRVKGFAEQLSCACRSTRKTGGFRRPLGPHCLTMNVTGVLTARVRAGSPNRVGGAGASTRWHLGRGLLHSNTDDSRRGDRLDRVPAAHCPQSLFPWLLRGADFDNDSAFMNDVVVPWCRSEKIEVTRSRAYKKNDQAFVEQKNGAVVRRLVGYGRFEGVETAAVIARLYAAARLHVSFFQPSFKLKEKRREGAKLIKRYHPPATPYARALAHPKVSKAIKTRLRAIYRTLDPVALLAEMRAAQDALGTRIDARAGKTRVVSKVTIGETATVAPTVQSGTATFAKALGTTIEAGEPRATHRKPKRRYKTRVRMPSMLDPHVATIEGWLAAEPPLTALTILGRLIEGHPDQFGPKQESIVQRLLRTLRTQAAQRIIAAEPVAATPDHVERPSPRPPGTVDGSGWAGPDHSPSTCPSPRAISRRHVTQARVTFSDEAIRGAMFGAD